MMEIQYISKYINFHYFLKKPLTIKIKMSIIAARI